MNLREMDIRREERQAALAEGMQIGRMQGVVEAAVVAVRDFNITPQFAAQKMNVPLEKIMEELNKPNYEQNHESGL